MAKNRQQRHVGIRLLLLFPLMLMVGWALELGRTSAETKAPIHPKSIFEGEGSPTTIPTPLPDCSGAWQIVSSPSPSIDISALNAVVATSPDNAWAVGAYGAGGRVRTLTLRWDGNQWNHISSPSPGTNTDSLLNVDAVSASDVWAVGYTYTPGNGRLTLAEHWDGTQWSIIPSPNVVTTENYLRAVSALAPNDVWAVGYYVASGAIGVRRTLVEHWDGTQWSIIPSPNVGPDNNEVWSVTAISPGDVWAVGSYRNIGIGQTLTLILHWDGVQWSVVPSPNPSGAIRSVLNAVSGTSSNNVWAVGVYQYAQAYTQAHTQASEAFQGSEASAERFETRSFIDARPEFASSLWSPGSPGSFVSPVSAVSPESPDAVGWTLIEHWNGVEWSIVPSPNAGPNYSELRDVHATSSTDAWAVGYYCCDAGQKARTVIEHWDGEEWSLVSSPSVPNHDNYLNGVAAGPASANYVWAVGYSFACLTCPRLTLTERYYLPDSCPSPSPTPLPTHTTTSTLTSTPTRTNTPPSNTPTPSNTSTPTFTNTPTFTHTPTAGATPLATATPPAGTPRPSSTSSPSPAVSITPTATPSTPTPCPLGFSDVLPTDYFYEAVQYLVCRGVVSGYADGTFRPYNLTTRGQLAKIVVLAEGWAIDTSGGPHFSDVLPSSTFYDYIETAYNHQVISGYGDGTFRPFNNVTRGQLCKIVVVARGWPVDTSGGPHFSDVPQDSNFYEQIETAYNHGIISGYADGTFRAGSSATRGQIAKIVYSAISQ